MMWLLIVLAETQLRKRLFGIGNFVDDVGLRVDAVGKDVQQLTKEWSRTGGQVRALAEDASGFVDVNRKPLTKAFHSMPEVLERMKKTIENVDGLTTKAKEAVKTGQKDIAEVAKAAKASRFAAYAVGAASLLGSGVYSLKTMMNLRRDRRNQAGAQIQPPAQRIVKN